jgi:hypothetical protein
MKTVPWEAVIALPLGFGLLAGTDRVPEPLMTKSQPITMFGMVPGVRMARMPSRESREPMHRLIPALSQAHGGQVPESDRDYPWLDLRPEVIITPFLKAFVTAGVEAIPFENGFPDPPLLIQFIRCRFHFRQDRMMDFFPKFMKATWDEAFLSNMLLRCREAYTALYARASELPGDEIGLELADEGRLRDGFVAFWNAFSYEFSLSFLIQAQGDDCIHPGLRAIVDRNKAALGSEAGAWRLPGLAELSAPVTPVLTAEYMQDLVDLNHTLVELGLTSVDEALAAVDQAADPRLQEAYERVRGRWFWMRERDIYYEPYDTPRSILNKALGVREIPALDYESNKARAEFALALHFDLARQFGSEERLVYAVKYGRALAIDRENHHIVWLRASYRLRKQLLEWERRLAPSVSLPSGFIFFMQPWEILDAVQALPVPIGAELRQRIRSRRAVYESEIQLTAGRQAERITYEEEDYY